MLSPYQVLNNDIDGCGIQCKYKQINPNVGFKFLSAKNTAEEVYENHRILEQIGYGPRVLSGIFPFKTLENTYYGFMIEHCVTLKEVILSVPHEMCVELRNKIYHLVDYVEKTMSQETGYYSGDAHAGNFGITKNGKIVCIDSGYLYRLSDE